MVRAMLSCWLGSAPPTQLTQSSMYS